MAASEFIALLVVWVAALVSPGPDVVQIIRLGSSSRSAGVWAAFGIMTGNALWVVASLLGLSALVSTYPSVLAVLQLVGGVYLSWMGVSAVRGGLATRRQPASPPRDDAPPAPVVSVGASRAWRIGLTTNLANPKALLFFGAVFAQFIHPGMGAGQAVVVAGVMIVVGLVWFVGFALAVGLLARRLVRSGAVIDVVTGVVFVALGLFMLVEGVSALVGWVGTG